MLDNYCVVLLFFSCRTRTYNTRSDDDYSYNIMHTKIRKFTISYQGPLLWNKFPLSLRQTNHILKFKSALKEFTKTLDKWEHLNTVPLGTVTNVNINFQFCLPHDP